MNDTELTLCMPHTLRHAQAMEWLQSLDWPPRGQAGVLDASALQSFDSSALACMIELKRRALERGVVMRTVGIPDRLGRLAQAYGLAELI